MTIRDHIHYKSIGFMLGALFLSLSVWGLFTSASNHIEYVDKVVSNKTVIIDGEPKNQIEIIHYKNQVPDEPDKRALSILGLLLSVIGTLTFGIFWLVEAD